MVKPPPGPEPMIDITGKPCRRQYCRKPTLGPVPQQRPRRPAPGALSLKANVLADERVISVSPVPVHRFRTPSRLAAMESSLRFPGDCAGSPAVQIQFHCLVLSADIFSGDSNTHETKTPAHGRSPCPCGVQPLRHIQDLQARLGLERMGSLWGRRRVYPCQCPCQSSNFSTLLQGDCAAPHLPPNS